MTKTIRRDTLRDLVGAGDVHLENGMTPVRMMPADRNMRDGVCYLLESDFTSRSGKAWRNTDGTVTLKVHSDYSVTMRVGLFESMDRIRRTRVPATAAELDGL